jgi:predicted esterase
MSREPEDRIDEVFQAALDLPPGERDAFVEGACAADADLRRAVDRLLGAHARAEAEGFMEAPAFEPTVELDASEVGRPEVGQLIGRYRVVDRIGAGGMGEVFVAHDESLDRRVALKLVTGSDGQDEERVRRFRQEALAASSLNHPNIVTIHEVGPWDKGGFMAMELIEGSTLRRLTDGSPMPLPQALDIAGQLTRALSAAHGAGIVHRDVKPENIMVRADGLVKVLDFGIAKYGEREGDRTARETLVQTKDGMVVGTTAYMSPEQARGLVTDARTDIWAFGCVLYEMLAGRQAFGRNTPSDTIAAVLGQEPDWSALPATAPPALRRLLQECLTKDPAGRPRDLSGARAQLAEAQALDLKPPNPPAWRTALSGPRGAVLAAMLVLILMGLAAWWRHGASARWALNVALPEIGRLVENEDDYHAFILARQAQRHLAGNAALERFWIDHSFPLSLETSPSGARVSMKPYREVDAPWEPLGQTPLKALRVPLVHLRLRVEKDGFEPLEVASDISGPMRVRRFTLDETDKAPKGMVHVPGGIDEDRSPPDIALDDFWLDRYEVTNRQYKEFVDQGGYRGPEHWKEPFLRDGRVLAWEEAVALFRDSTGRPGPASWEVGTYRDGQADHPVGGISWFEAAAYARFAKKELPTVHHWMRAAGESFFADILLLSNFSGSGSAAVGSHQGLSPYGAYDLAGNVKEWCWNAVGEKRYILGGGWNEPSYVFGDPDAKSPWDRAPSHGFRCAKYAAGAPPEQLAPIDLMAWTRNYAAEKPVSDAVYRIYRGFYSYDKTDLKATVDSVEESEHWRHERVSFDAAYGGERVPAHLFLPTNASPPYQIVVYWPSGEAHALRRSDALRMERIEFLLRSGRGVLLPIYKSTYERHGPEAGGPSQERDVFIQAAKDLQRSIDYLETRADIDVQRLAFYGVSWGASLAPPLLAIESRFKAAVLLSGGLGSEKPLPEIDPYNFTPRVTLPVLMLNGRYDFVMPLETSQRPLFRLLASPAKDKRHVLFESGHAGHPMHELMKEILDWLDRYLGPVRQSQRS